MGQAKTKKTEEQSETKAEQSRPKYEDVLAAALLLTPEERETLVGDLVGGAIDPEIEKAHLAEVHRRIAQQESGGVEYISHEELMSRVRLRKR